MITIDSFSLLNDQELAYLFDCCNREFEKNGYVYFGFDLIKIFKKQTIIDIINKYSYTLGEDLKNLPLDITKKIEHI